MQVWTHPRPIESRPGRASESLPKRLLRLTQLCHAEVNFSDPLVDIIWGGGGIHVHQPLLKKLKPTASKGWRQGRPHTLASVHAKGSSCVGMDRFPFGVFGASPTRCTNALQSSRMNSAPNAGWHRSRKACKIPVEKCSGGAFRAQQIPLQYPRFSISVNPCRCLSNVVAAWQPPYYGCESKICKMESWKVETWTRTCGPIPDGLIFTHTHVLHPA